MTNSNPRIDGSTSSEYLFAVGSDVDFQFEDLPEPSDEEASLNDPYLSDVEGPVLSRKDRRTSGASCSLRPSSSSKHYAVLTLEDVEQMAQAIVEETSDILTVDHFVAEYLLHKYRWESSILAQDWIEDTQRVAKKAGIGLPTQPPQETSVENPAEAFLCPITADVVPMAETDALSCGHRFSNECWSRYLELTVTEEGAEACLAKQCPMYDCRVPIPLGFWKRHLSASSYSKLLQFRSQ